MIYCTASRAYVITICVPVLSFDTASLPAGNTGLEKLTVLVVSESLKRDLQSSSRSGVTPHGERFLLSSRAANATGQDFDCNRSTQIAKDRRNEGA